MAALLPVPGVARVACNGSLDGSPVANIFHWRKAGTAEQFTQSQINQLAFEFRNTFITFFLPRISNKYTLGEVIATDLSSDSAPVGVQAGTNVGGVAQVPLPANCALVVSWKSTRRYRGGHARSYFAGVSQSDTTNATTWTATAITNWQTAATSFMTVINALNTIPDISGFLCVVHRQQNRVPLDPPIVMPIIGRAVDTRIDSQRLRLGRDRPA